MISASSLHRHCGYPRALAKLAPRSERQQAALDLGTAFHGAVEKWARTGVLPEDVPAEVRGWLEVLAMTWSPPRGALFEIALGLNHDGGYVPVVETAPGSHVYEAAPGQRLLTAGRADVMHLEGATAVVRDWKTGRYPVDHPSINLQLLALGFAAAGYYTASAMRLEVYYARDGVTDAHTIALDSSEAADAWDEVEAAATLDETPRPGDHCGTCWERRTKRCEYAQEPAA